MSDFDKSGRTHMVKSVVTSWASHFVFIFFGFVMPRVISESVGQETLGVWDFSWSFISYLRLSMLGIGSSVNRFVARYRAAGDNQSLSATISSVVAIQSFIGIVVFLFVVLAATLIPTLLTAQLGDQAASTGKVVLFLGSALAVQMAFDAFRGIMTGCHRWGLHNALNAIGYTVSAMSMLFVIVNGGGLSGMALVYLIVTILTEMLRVVIARNVCPEIDFQLKLVNRPDIIKMVRFGLKTLLVYVPNVVIRQSMILLVMTFSGPGMLAVIMRPMALVSHVNTLVNKFAYVLTPTVGSLQADGKGDEVREFSLVTMRAGWILTLLPTTFLLILGDRVVDLWMGPGYADWALVAILTGGAILPMSQRATMTTMVGLDKHGSVAAYSAVASILTFLASIVIALQIEWSLELAAWLIVLPANVGMGAMTLIRGCRELNVSVPDYIRHVLFDPVILFLVTGASLLIVRNFGPQDTSTLLLLGSLIHAVVSAVMLRNDIRKALASFSQSRNNI